MSDAGDTTAPAPPPPNPFGRVMLYGAIITSLVILVGFVAAALMLFFFEVPEKSQATAASMFNTLQTLAILAAGFWLGSSASSAQRAAANAGTPPKPPGT